jgi:RHS repeat-associated protein
VHSEVKRALRFEAWAFALVAFVLTVLRSADVFAYDATAFLSPFSPPHGGVADIWGGRPPQLRKTAECSQSEANAPAVGGHPFLLLSPLSLTLAQTHVTYDVLDNPVLIEDLRSEAEWPAGHKPQSRAMTYDGLNRVTGVTYSYAGAPPAGDTWTSPHKSEHDGYRGGNTLGQRGIPKPENNFPKRVQSETYAYDALGNRTQTDDDAHGFWDRSLGTESHSAATGKPYQLASAQQSAAGGSFNGSLTASYDAMGNTTSLSVFRPTVTGALCMPNGAACSQRFAYSWDEVNRLVRARRWDAAPAALGAASAALPAAVPNADLQYAYDASDARVRTSYASEPVGQRHTLQVFPSLELRKTSYVGAGASAEYTLSDQVETVYAVAPGTGLRLAKIVSRSAMSTGYGAGQGGALPNADGPVTPSGPVVLLHVQDALGSVSAVIEKSSGELVEARGYHPYGNEEHDLRSARWNYLREDIGFTGKEVDVEVGLTYFGKRYLVASTGRWLNPDPLALHVPGRADANLYAYVNGRVFVLTDPMGLEPPGWMSRLANAAFNVGAGVAVGFVPGGGIAAEARLSAEKQQLSPDARFQFGLGQIFGGALAIGFGAGGAGTGAVLTVGSGGVAAPAGVPLTLGGAVLAAGGVTNVAVGVRNVTNALLSKMRGSESSGTEQSSAGPPAPKANPAEAAKKSAAAEGGSANGAKGEQVRANAEKGKAFEEAKASELREQGYDVSREVTVKSGSGTKTRIDIVAKKDGQIRCIECKSSETAPLTPNQKTAHPEIGQTGGTVVGEGKPSVPGGTSIPPTPVEIHRP